MSELLREALRRYESERAYEQTREKLRASADALGIRTEEDVAKLIGDFRSSGRTGQQAATRRKTGTHA